MFNYFSLWSNPQPLNSMRHLRLLSTPISPPTLPNKIKIKKILLQLHSTPPSLYIKLMLHQMDGSRTRNHNMSTNSTTTTTIQDNAGGAYPYNARVLLAAVILLSVVVFFVILLHIYARWFLRRRHTGIARAVSEPLRTIASFPSFLDDVTFFSKGLDSKYIASLPMFVVEGYSSELDCVVCLSLMEEGEVGRRLPRCGHVFHTECIDMWLMSNSTCPICRAQVKEEEAAATVVVEVVVEDEEEVNGVVDELALDDSTHIVVKVDDESTMPSSSSSTIGSMHIMMKGDDELLPTSSSPSPSSCSCSSSISLKRMVSKSRSESRVFPSAVN